MDEKHVNDLLIDWLRYLFDRIEAGIVASGASDFLGPWMTDTDEKLKGFYPTNLGIIPKKLGYSK